MHYFWQGFYKAAEEIKRVAKVALFKDGKLCMGKRRDNKKFTEPGGHLNPGEDPLSGAIREVKEETGVTLEKQDLTSLRNETVSPPDQKGKKIEVFTYTANLPEGEKTTMKEDPDAEVFRWNWVDISKGIPKHIGERLHVPMAKNVVLRGLKEKGVL